jgi:site-specific DNA-methyltransferase (adenine-specific)
MGSGTTLQVAEQLNKKGIGIELNPEYIKIAEERLKSTDSYKKIQQEKKIKKFFK